MNAYESILSLFSNIYIGKLYNHNQLFRVSPCFFFHSFEQTTQVSSLPSTYGGHFKEPHRPSTR